MVFFKDRLRKFYEACEFSKKLTYVRREMLKEPGWINNQENRDRWVEEVLQSIPKGSLILDAGAGEQRYKKFCNHLNYTSQDFGQYSGGDGEGLQESVWDYGKLDIVSDICNLPVEDSYYDIVLCTEVLEHVFDPIEALREMCRVLKPGGKIVLTAPFNSLTHFAPYFYQTGFSKFFYIEFARRYNFNIDYIMPNGDFYKYLAQELGRLKSESFLPKEARAPELSEELNLIKSSVDMLSFFLRKYSRVRVGRDDILCFGYHVIMSKNNVSC